MFYERTRNEQPKPHTLPGLARSKEWFAEPILNILGNARTGILYFKEDLARLGPNSASHDFIRRGGLNCIPENLSDSLQYGLCRPTDFHLRMLARQCYPSNVERVL